MYVLGVNGWVRGIHDSSAALFRDGKLIACAEEERFIRRKHAFNTVPHNAIAYCLRAAGITPDEVDHIAVGWDLIALDRWYGKETKSETILEFIFPRSRFPRRRDPELHLIPHHVAHAAGAFYSSGFPEAAVLVVDGSGEAESVTLAHGSAAGLRIIEQYPLRSSLGIFYAAVTQFVGLGAFAEGKTMGLAPYGRAEISFPSLLDGPPNLKDKDTQRDPVVHNAWLEYFRTRTGREPNPRRWVYEEDTASLADAVEIPEFYAHFAASGQAALEQALLELADRCLSLTGSTRLCLSGGVALNCVANRKVALHPQVRELYVQPPASDAGVSIGAAAYISSQLGKVPVIPPDHVYGGPEFSPDQLREILNRFGLAFHEPADMAEEVSKLLLADKVIARFCGRMEVGPRALGNRSILANPQRRSMHERVNRIKRREQWRPLAPSVPVEYLPDLMEEPVSSPYMLVTTTVRPDRRQEVSAIVHVDGSTRAQAVSREINPDYWRLLHRFHAGGGPKALLNTSFNIGGEPIVCSPVDAIRAFFASELDGLILGPFLLVKKP